MSILLFSLLEKATTFYFTLWKIQTKIKLFLFSFIFPVHSNIKGMYISPFSFKMAFKWKHVFPHDEDMAFCSLEHCCFCLKYFWWEFLWLSLSWEPPCSKAKHCLKWRKQISDFSPLTRKKSLLFFNVHILNNNYLIKEEKVLDIPLWLCAQIEGF